MSSVPGSPPGQARRRWRARATAALILITALVPLLAACGPDAKSTASANKTKLDSELHTASKAGVPARLLAPIITQENALETTASSSGSNSAYQSAADGYTKLYNQVAALTKWTPSQAQSQATNDLSKLQQSLATTEASQYADVVTAAKAFDPTVPQAQQMLTTAKTTKEYFAADEFILDQEAAVAQVLPVYQQIQTLDGLVTTENADLAAPQQSHVLSCATEGGEIPQYGTVPAQFWAAQNAYPIMDPNATTVKPAVPMGNYYFSSWPTAALTAFQDARTADDFSTLNVNIQGQINQLEADMQPAALQREQAGAAVAQFQDDVNTYQSDIQANNTFLTNEHASAKGVPDYKAVWSLTQNPNGWAPPDNFYINVPNFTANGSYAQQVAQDQKTLAAAKTADDYSALIKTVRSQQAAMSFDLVKVEGYYDISVTLKNLIAQGQSTTTNVTYAGVLYKTPNAYEYADDNLRYDEKDTVGIEDAEIRYDQSRYREGYVSHTDAVADYTAVENEAQMFIHNLSADITNLAQMPTSNAARAAWSMQVHQTDLDLINYYGLQNAKVIVVSLREQKARLYQNGKLVVGSDGKPYAFDVTTGSPDKPSPPGIHCALPPLKGPPGGDVFKSPDAPGSPFYYLPTPVHYSFGYSLYGYYLHDSWWRDDTEMGYLTNLPHYDPAAFNGGSHGCINFHYANGDMGKVYAFASTGAPIIVY